MRVLMFGWEFPPHITGGLGTACYGLTKALSVFDDLDLTFVVPKAFGDEDKTVAKFIGAEQVPVSKSTIEEKHSLRKIKDGYKFKISEKNIFERIKYIEVASQIKPYISPEDFELGINKGTFKEHYFYIKDDGKIFIVIEGKEIEIHAPSMRVETESNVYFNFSGTYGYGLLSEVSNYSYVASQLALNEDFDLIHAHDWLTYPAGVAAKNISGKKLVIHVHATEFDRSGENVNQIVYDIERYGMENADKIITVSNLTRQIVISRYGIPEEKVTVDNLFRMAIRHCAQQ